MGPKPRPRSSRVSDISTSSKNSSIKSSAVTKPAAKKRKTMESSDSLVDNAYNNGSEETSKNPDESKDEAKVLTLEPTSNKNPSLNGSEKNAVKESNDKDIGSDEEEESSDDADIYEMEQIISHKKGRDGKILYRVRWKNYPPEQDTWEPVDNFIGPDCKRLLRCYWEKCKVEQQEKCKQGQEKEPIDEEIKEKLSEKVIKKEAVVKKEEEKPASRIETRTPILTNEDMDTGNDLVPTCSAMFQREKSSSTSATEDSDEDFDDVVFGIGATDGKLLTREQKRLLVTDVKLTDTDKALIELQTPDSGTRLTRGSLRKIRGSTTPVKEKQETYASLESKRRQSSRKSITPKLALKEPKEQPKKRGRKPKSKVSAKNNSQSVQDEKMEEQEIDQTAEQLLEPMDTAQDLKQEVAPAVEQVPEVSKVVEKVPDEVSKPRKSEASEKIIKTEKKEKSKKAKLKVEKEQKKSQQVKELPKDQLAAPIIQVTDAKTPAELKAEMLAKKKSKIGVAVPFTPVLKKPKILDSSKPTPVSLIPSSNRPAIVSDTYINTIKPEPETTISRRSIPAAKKSDLNETPPEEPLPKTYSLGTGHRNLSADLPMEVTSGVKIEDFVMQKIRETNQAPVITPTQNQFEEFCLDGRVDKVRDALRAPPNGLNLNHIDDQGRSILHRLCANSCDLHHSLDEIIDILYTNQAQLNVVDLMGRTPLHIAVLNKSICHVRKLLSLRAHMNVEDKDGNLPIYYALNYSDTTILSDLLNAGAAYHRVRNKHQLVKDHDSRLTLAFNDERKKILLNMTVEKLLTSIFVNTCWEKPEISHHFLIDQMYLAKAADSGGFLLTVGVADFSAAQPPRIRMTGDLPISKVFFNDKELEPINDACRYVYALGNVKAKNHLKISVNQSYLNSSNKILTQIVFIQLNNRQPMRLSSLGQPPTYRPSSIRNNNNNNSPHY